MTQIYLDSCLIIYLVEQHPDFAPQVRAALATARDALFTVSVLTRLEVLTVPRRLQDEDLTTRYEMFLARLRHLPIDDQVIDEALMLRVKGLKTPDALHVALARHHGCTALWTNDDRLAKVVPGFGVNLRGLADL